MMKTIRIALMWFCAYTTGVLVANVDKSIGVDFLIASVGWVVYLLFVFVKVKFSIKDFFNG